MANPENNANVQASAPTNVSKSNSRAQFEAERMTRRAALRKFGFGAGMAALMALSTDDLARMAAKKLKQHSGDNRVANQVANEFKNAGVAFADSSGGPCSYVGCDGCPGKPTLTRTCVSCALFCSTWGTRQPSNGTCSDLPKGSQDRATCCQDFINWGITQNNNNCGASGDIAVHCTDPVVLAGCLNAATT